MNRSSHSFLASVPGLRRLDPLDRSVLALTLAVWAMHWAMRTMLSFMRMAQCMAHTAMHWAMRTMLSFMPSDQVETGVITARTIASTIGVLLCLGIHVVLKKVPRDRPWRLLGLAMLLSVPAALFMVWVGEYIFGYFTNYYTMYPDRWMSWMELGETYKAYQWNLFAWCALYAAACNIFEVRRRDQQLAAATSAAQQAQLLALRLQINPHFLFNTLNTLAGLIVLNRNVESERMVLSLSRFLRYTLASAPSQMTTLADELGMLRQYLEIEGARFSDRLKVSWKVDDDCARSLVPTLILLPLVENALKYGLAESERPVEIVVGARRVGAQMVLWVEDDGGAKHGNQASGLGIGLSNVRQRLEALYGDTARLQSGDTAKGWLSAIHLPYQDGVADLGAAA